MSSDDRADRLRNRRNESKKKAEQRNAESDTEEAEKNDTTSSTSEDTERVRDRKSVTMYLPDDLNEELRLTWLKYAADNPGAEKNKDFFTEVLREGLKHLDVNT